MNQKKPTLRFLGAAGTVTGSKYLIEADDTQILLDCGLFQGLKDLRLRNWRAPDFDINALAAVVLSHAHLDHSGYLPLLVKRGFEGPIHCTPATAELLGVMLPDSGSLQEEDAARANKKGYSKHTPALPLYTADDARRTLQFTKKHGYGDSFEVASNMHAIFRRAGHILGSATAELNIHGASPVRLVFSGDLGRRNRPILRDPEPVYEADVLLIESTYGDRVHDTQTEERLASIITDTAHRGGAVIIPSFAIGRAQELIWTLRKLEDEGRLPLISVYVDSPMAIRATEIYCRHPEDHDLDMIALADEKRCPLCCQQYHLARTPQESKTINSMHGPVVIIAGSGMATGGRVLHHLKYRLPDHRNTVLLVGYQAAGTRGRALQDGATEIRIHGSDVPVRARVETLDGMSAHADQNEILEWLSMFKRAPRHTYVVHGEPPPAQALAETLRKRLKWVVDVARDGESIEL